MRHEKIAIYKPQGKAWREREILPNEYSEGTNPAKYILACRTSEAGHYW